MAKININKFYLSTITKDEIGTGNLVFAKPEYIPGVQQIGAKFKTDTAKLYEEGVISDQDTTLTDIEFSVDLGHFSNTQYAKYLGHHIAKEGGVYALEDDKAPYVAALIEYTKNGGVKGYKSYYKGQLTEPDDAIKQKEGKIDYQNITATATFQPLRNNGMTTYCVEEDDPNCPEDIATKFFESVIIPTEKTAVPGSETYTITTNAAATDTVKINNITFTAVSSGAAGNQFNVGADTTATAANLASALNANTTVNELYSATSSENTVTLTEKVAGGGNTPTTATTTGTIVITNGTVVNSQA